MINLSFSQEIFNLIRIYHPDKQLITSIQKLGIALDHSDLKKGEFIDLVISDKESSILDGAGIIFEVLIYDLSKYYLENNVPAIQRNFPLGSMQGNYTWGELNLRFSQLKDLYPDIISDKLIIGQSVEGNDIWAFKVSDNPGIDENEPEVLFTGLTHAREPLSMMNLFYFVQNICEAYSEGVDQEASYLVEEREIWFVPVINPDGYIYNETIAPNGGGMHRKNRKNTDCGSGTERGVDLNRNFSYNWGDDDTGSSSDPCYATYRGQSSFSEPEAQAVRDFINQRNFVNVLHYHSYGNMYIHPFGDGTLPEEPDLTIYRELGKYMAIENNFSVGSADEMVGYTVNGDAVDWSYADRGIYAFTPEVGQSGYGFWPPSNEVELICKYQYEPNKIFAFCAGSDFVLDSYTFSNDIINPGDSLSLELMIKNRGLAASDGAFQINIEPLSTLFQATIQNDEPIIINKGETKTFNIMLQISEQISNYSKLNLKVELSDNSSFFRVDTIEFYVGTSYLIYSENFNEGINQWSTTGEWGLSNNPAIGAFSLSDSPSGEYGAEQNTTASLNINFNFNYISYPHVLFSAIWDIEDGYDFVQFQALTEEDGWVSLVGDYTVSGNGSTVQPLGEHGYDGTQLTWVDERIFLDQLGGATPVAFRFLQSSDQAVEGDGFTVDNFAVSGYLQGLIGDFSSDGKVDIIDIISLADLLMDSDSPSDYVSIFCDMDNNGLINILDLLNLVSKVINN